MPHTPRHRIGLSTFVLFAFGIPWLGWVTDAIASHPSKNLEMVSFVILPCACSLAGFVAAFAEGGLPGLVAFSKRVFNLRFSGWLWLLAFVAPFIAGLMTFVYHPSDLIAGGVPDSAKITGAISFSNLLTGPLAEEFGWRGYLLQRLRSRFSPTQAGLIIAPIWALWHLPLFYNSVFAHLDSSLKFIVILAALSVIMALIVERANGSALPAILLHFIFNIQGSLFGGMLPALPGDKLPGGLAMGIALSVLAVILRFLVLPRLVSAGARPLTMGAQNDYLEKQV